MLVRLKFPVQGKIISNYGEGKGYEKIKKWTCF